MDTNLYSVIDLAAYDLIEISNLKIPVIAKSSKKLNPQTKLMAKWIKNEFGQLTCCWIANSN